MQVLPLLSSFAGTAPCNVGYMQHLKERIVRGYIRANDVKGFYDIIIHSVLTVGVTVLTMACGYSSWRAAEQSQKST